MWMTCVSNSRSFEASGARARCVHGRGGSGAGRSEAGQRHAAEEQELRATRPSHAVTYGCQGLKITATATTKKTRAFIGPDLFPADLVDGEPGIALQAQGLSQVYLKVAVQAGHSLAAVHVDSGHPFL